VSSYAVAQPQNVSAPQEKTAETISLQRQRSNQTEPAVLHERIFDEGCKTFAEPRFGYDFSLVQARTDMMRQAQPLLSTRTMVQRYPVNGDTESIPCAICSDEESTSSSASAESAVETASLSPEATPTPASAEPEEESVTSEETATPEETAAPALIVEDSVTELSAGQMRKSEFIIQLRAAVTSTAESAMAGTGRTTADCPYLEYWFGYYSLRSAQHGESALRRYAPEASRATSAREYISIVTGRVRRSVETWVRTGEVTGVPEGIPTELPGAGLLERIGSVFFKAREGGARRPNDPRAIQSQLGRGQPLNSGVRSRMESAFGRDFSQVRTHTDTTAAGLSDRLNARAFTVGEHVAFGSGEYKPGTLFGDALIAHEMAHVVQQSSASDSVAPLQTGDTGYNTLEKDADRSAMGAVASLWTGAKDALSDIAQNAIPRLRSGLRLQRCQERTPGGVSLGPTDKTKTFCLKPGSFTVTTGIGSNTVSSATGRQDMKFEGLSTGKQDGKTCSCDCGLYRHWIKGYWRSGSATAAKQYNVTSWGRNLTINESTFTEEYTSLAPEHDPDPCKWHYNDFPGWRSGLSDGSYVELQYTFKYQIWDRCQGKSVATAPQKTLNISGDKRPRVITWT